MEDTFGVFYYVQYVLWLNGDMSKIALVAINALYATIFLFKAFSLRLLHVLNVVGANCNGVARYMKLSLGR